MLPSRGRAHSGIALAWRSAAWSVRADTTSARRWFVNTLATDVRFHPKSGHLAHENITRAVVLGRLQYRPYPNARLSVRLAPGKYRMK